MNYNKSQKYNEYMHLIMGPNPVKLLEELTLNVSMPQDSTVLDLGSGNGLTSLFLAKEFGFRVFAADLWSNPTDVMNFFTQSGMTSQNLIPIHADANDLPFANDFFDAVFTTDSYNYFGRDKNYLDEKLLPFVKSGGYVYIAVPGMKKDLHGNLPMELLLSWDKEQLDYIHDTLYWRDIVSASKLCNVVSVGEMESNEEVWQDWLQCDNEYAIGDRKTMEAGGGKYLNFISIVLQKI